jgi:sn-glycerol 3-phosphate transport system substrate-binding protein
MLSLVLLLGTVLVVGTASAESKPIQITWWHSMGGDLGKEVNKLVDEFNASQSKYKVKPIYKGQYAESLTDAIAAYRAGHQPDILQVYEVGTGAMLAAGNAVFPVYKLMQKAGVDFSADEFIPAISAYYSDADGRLLSMPFNTSTPVLYYNKDEFKKAGIKAPPETWQALEADARKLKAAGVKCGYSTGWQSWINLENYAAWHDLPFATKDNGYAGLDVKLLVNKKPFVEHIARLGKMAQEGLFKYGGRQDKANQLFLGGTCAMYTESSGFIVPFNNSAPFDLGVAMMPFNADLEDHPQNSILGGATLWVLSGNPKSHYKGIAEFLNSCRSRSNRRSGVRRPAMCR